MASSEAKFRAFGHSLTGIASMTGLAIGAALVVGGAAIAVGIGLATKSAADFQSGLTALVTGAGESQANLALVGKGLLDMSGQVGVSASDLVKGMFMIESAGYRGADGLRVQLAAAQAAKVGNADLAVTADAVTTVMKDYHLSTFQAADAANFLVSVVSQGKTHMEDLAASMASILPTASALNIPLSQIGGAMAAITSRGVPASDAATQLKFTLMALVHESSKGAGALTEIGTSSEEVGKVLTNQGLLPAIQLINDKLMKAFPNDTAARVSALTDIFGGKKGLAGALQVTGQNLGDFVTAASNVAGAVDKNHGKVMGWALVQQDLNSKIDRAKGALGALAIELGTKLLPYAGQFLDWASGMIPKLAAFASDALPKVVKAIEDLWKTIQTKVLPALKEFWGHLVAIWTVFVTLLKPILKEISKHSEQFKLILEAVGVVVLLLVGFIAGLVLGFALLVLGVMDLIRWFQYNMKPAFDDLNNAITGSIGFVRILIGVFDDLVSAGEAAAKFLHLGGGDTPGTPMGATPRRSGGRAGGGQILAGWSGWVGEKGPEYVTAGGPANVHNAADSKRMGGVSLTVNNYGGVTDPEAIRRTLQRMAYLGAV